MEVINEAKRETINADSYEQFQARLDMAPNSKNQLPKTMLTPVPWER
jgi:uncharacterized protein (DUF1778 family)